MENLTEKAIRIAGIALSAPALIVSVLMVFALQGLGSGPWWETTAVMVAVLANPVAIPLAIAGFIMKYKFRISFYAAIVQLALVIVASVIVISGVGFQQASDNLLAPAIVVAPSLAYLLGWSFEQKRRTVA